LCIELDPDISIEISVSLYVASGSHGSMFHPEAGLGTSWGKRMANLFALQTMAQCPKFWRFECLEPAGGERE
jgi:hypothetical protein